MARRLSSIVKRGRSRRDAAGICAALLQHGRAAQAWIPLSSTPPASPDALTVVARLEQGVTIAVAQSQVDSVTARRATERGDSRYQHAYLEPVGASAAAELQPGLFLLQGVALLLLLITCANLGNLFLVHTSARYGEFAVRAGLGARPIDLLRHVFAEAGIVATAGAALGVAVAYVTSAWLRSIAAPVLPQWISVHVDLTDLTVVTRYRMDNGRRVRDCACGLGGTRWRPAHDASKCDADDEPRFRPPSERIPGGCAGVDGRRPFGRRRPPNSELHQHHECARGLRRAGPGDDGSLPGHCVVRRPRHSAPARR